MIPVLYLKHDVIDGFIWVALFHHAGDALDFAASRPAGTVWLPGSLIRGTGTCVMSGEAVREAVRLSGRDVSARFQRAIVPLNTEVRRLMRNVTEASHVQIKVLK